MRKFLLLMTQPRLGILWRKVLFARHETYLLKWRICKSPASDFRRFAKIDCLVLQLNAVFWAMKHWAFGNTFCTCNIRHAGHLESFWTRKVFNSNSAKATSVKTFYQGFILANQCLFRWILHLPNIWSEIVHLKHLGQLCSFWASEGDLSLDSCIQVK